MVHSAQQKASQSEPSAKSNNKADRDGKRRRILNAAERVFARSGYDGAGMRQISVEAGVAQALIHYHFETKERLFEAVVARRSGEINGQRVALLDGLFEVSKNPTLEEIADVLLRPTIEVGHQLENPTNDFARILVSVANSSGKRSTELAERYYDPMARKFIAAFEKSTPGLGHENAVWAYMFAIGVGMTMMAQTGRPQRLSGGLCDDSDVEAMLARIIPFITAGVRAVAGIETKTE